MPLIPAMRNTAWLPIHCQKAMVSNMGMIWLGDIPQRTRSRPNSAQISFTKPRLGLKSHVPTTPMVTVGRTAGIKKTVRKNPRPHNA